jgi:hypothetical protein
MKRNTPLAASTRQRQSSVTEMYNTRNIAESMESRALMYDAMSLCDETEG